MQVDYIYNKIYVCTQIHIIYISCKTKTYAHGQGQGQQAPAAAAAPPRLTGVPSRLKSVWRRYVRVYTCAYIYVNFSVPPRPFAPSYKFHTPLLCTKRISIQHKYIPKYRYAKLFNALPDAEHEGLRQVRTGLLEAWRNHLLAEVNTVVYMCVYM